MGAGLTFDEPTHTYRYDGRVVPSVTQILKRVYPDVYSGIPAAILDRKAKLGTATHKAIELELLGKLDPGSLHAEVLPYFQSWRKWWGDYIGPCFKVERKFYSALGYAGQIDFQMTGVIDWKITSTRVKTHRIQIGGYAMAADAKEGGCLYLKSDGSKAEYEAHDIKRATSDWLATLRVYNLQESMR